MDDRTYIYKIFNKAIAGETEERRLASANKIREARDRIIHLDLGKGQVREKVLDEIHQLSRDKTCEMCKVLPMGAVDLAQRWDMTTEFLRKLKETQAKAKTMKVRY